MVVLLAVLVLLCLTLSAIPGFSSVVKRFTAREMAQRADAILVGRVIGITPRWSGDTRGIVTDVTVRVETSIKHTQPGETVRVTVPGGTVGGMTVCVRGTPDFVAGERALFYLERTSVGDLGVLGWQQGRWRIEDGYLAGTTWSERQAVSEIQRALGLPQTGVRPGLVQRGPMKVIAPEAVQRAIANRGAGDRPAVVTTLLQDGFEGAFPGSTWITINDPHWGKTNAKKHGGSSSVYCCQDGNGAVDPPGPYPANMLGWMVAGPFDLTDTKEAHLEFYLWLKSESNMDGVLWGASTDGQSFGVAAVSGDSQGNWVHCPGDLQEFDFYPYLYQSQVWIGFIFASDASNQLEGAYLDDVKFTKTPATGPTPVFNSITPNAASANTGTPVTIKGTNFGTKKGRVRFPRVGSINDAQIVSWNDTTIKCKVPTADSGDVVVRSSGGKLSAPRNFGVTFGYMGCKLPDGKLADKRAYNGNGTPDCPGTAEFTALDTVFKTWTGVAGTKARCKKLANTTAMPSFTTADSKHILAWIETAWPFGSGAIAVTASWTNASNPTVLLDHDMVFNGEDFTWTCSGEAGKMDVQTIALHETGHWWGLDDLYGDADSAKTMYGFGSEGHVDHTLHAADKAGISWVYPAAASSAVAGGPAVSSLVALPVGRGAQILFSLAAPASVAVQVTNMAGRPIRTLCQAEAMAAGSNVILWDGQADNGLAVPNGSYLVQVVASAPGGGRARALTSATVSR
jgi:hypothetical protein